MYQLINKHRDAVLDTLDARANIPRYIELRSQLMSAEMDVRTNAGFQKEYRNYWGMNRRGEAFCSRYFDLLASSRKSGNTDIAAVVRDLSKDNNALEFSFATKLAHMVDPRIPVYDSLVAAFYFYPRPADKRFEDRLKRYLTFHEFLHREYERVLSQELLTPTLKDFRRRFRTTSELCDERIIDWIVWGSVVRLQQAAKLNDALLYE